MVYSPRVAVSPRPRVALFVVRLIRNKRRERVACGQGRLAGFLIVVCNQRFKQEEIGFQYVAVIGAAAGMHRIVRLRQAGGDEFEVLLAFINHKFFSH